MAVVIVFGATGFAGGAIASELVARGHRVTGVARDVSRLAANGVQPREGSLLNLPFFAEVTAGADVVVLATYALIDGQEKVADRVPDLPGGHRGTPHTSGRRWRGRQPARVRKRSAVHGDR